MGRESQAAAEAYIINECRRRSPGDYYFFTKVVLGHAMRNQGGDICERVHRPFCQTVTKKAFGHNKVLILAPRGSLKSTVVTEGYPLWRFINAIETYKLTKKPQVLSILIASHSLDNSKKFLRKIKKHITSNMLFRGCFMDSKIFPKGDWVPDPRDPLSQEEWTKEEIRLMGEGVDFSVEVASVDRAREGQHYDVIIIDDAHNRKNTRTRTGIEEVIAYFKSIVPLGQHGGGTDKIFIGTRWAQNDAYDWLMKHWGFAIEKGNMVVFRAIKEDGSLWFPELLSRDKLNEYRQQMSPYEFSAQFNNDPVPVEEQIFKQEWVYELESLPLKDEKDRPYSYVGLMAVDPGGPLEGNDMTGIVVVKVNQYNQIYVVAAEAGNWQDDEIVTKIFMLAHMYDVKVIGIEEVNFARRLKRDIHEKLRAREGWFRVQPVKYAGRSKNERIMGLQPEMINQRLFFVSPGMKDYTRLLNEILNFRPDREQAHDDLADALSYILDLAHPAPAAPKPKHDDFKDLLSDRKTYLDGMFWKNLMRPARRKPTPAWARF